MAETGFEAVAILETTTASLFAVYCEGGDLAGLAVALAPAGIWLRLCAAGSQDPQAVRLAEVSALLGRTTRRRRWPGRGFFTGVVESARAGAASAPSGMLSPGPLSPGPLPLAYVPYGSTAREPAGGGAAGSTAAPLPPREVGVAFETIWRSLRPALSDWAELGFPPQLGWLLAWLSGLEIMTPPSPAGEWEDEYRGEAQQAGRVGALLARQVHWPQGLRRAVARSGYILVDGEPAMPDGRVAAGVQLRVLLPLPPASGVVPTDGPLTVVFEDQDLLIVDKPPGVLTHPAHGQGSGTLVNLVAAYWQRTGEAAVPRPVGRLDRGTSGLVIFALTRLGQAALAAQRASGRFARSYLALTAAGPYSTCGLAFTASQPISSPPGDPGRYSQPRQSVTEVRVLSSHRAGCLVLANPHQGRTHQVRQHLAANGLPLYGDLLYGGPPAPRTALHAWQVEFDHPVTGCRLALRSALPPDLRVLYREIRLAADSPSMAPAAVDRGKAGDAHDPES